jgi:hypothetical protein
LEDGFECEFKLGEVLLCLAGMAEAQDDANQVEKIKARIQKLEGKIQLLEEKEEADKEDKVLLAQYLIEKRDLEHKLQQGECS